MGVTVSYTAIPPTSNLYTRFQKEKSLFVIAVDLFMTNVDLFEPLESEDDDILADCVEGYPKLFKSEMEVDEAITDIALLSLNAFCCERIFSRLL
jgi:hypothetical protein